jgi:hypothetical protein
MLNLSIQKRTEIILHFNKMHLQDASIPMWVVKAKGQTYYVNHVDMDSGIGFSTKETPDNPSTKGSLKFKGKLDITDENNTVNARIYG